MTEAMQLDSQSIMEGLRVSTEELSSAYEARARAERALTLYEAQVRVTCLSDSAWVNAKNDTIRQAVRDAVIYRTKEENGDNSYEELSEKLLEADVRYKRARLDYDLAKTWSDIFQSSLDLAGVDTPA